MKKKTILPMIAIGIIVAILLGTITHQKNTSQTADNEDGGIENIVIGVPNWSSAMTTAYILREILKENLGIEARLQSGTNEEGNETADALATRASARGPFSHDTGFA